MELREIIRNASAEAKRDAIDIIERHSDYTVIAQDGSKPISLFEIGDNFEFHQDAQGWYTFRNVVTILSGDEINTLATDYQTTTLTREEVLELLKEGNNISELPKNGWYVELPKNKDDIDLDKLRKAINHDYEFYSDSIRLHRFYYLSIGECPDCTDYHEGVKNLKNVTHLFLKQPEYTIDNLPEKWFVEINEDIDRELLCKKLGKYTRIKDYFEYYGKNNNQEYWDYLRDDDISVFYGYINVTHLFEKQEQSMQFNKAKEEKFINTEIIEIDGKKYQQVAIDCHLEGGDLFLAFKEVFKYVGFDGDSIIAKNSKFRYVDTGIALGEIKFKLEEIKTKTWHYAIYRCTNGFITTSSFYESKEELDKKLHNILEYRTFTEEI